MSQDPNAGAAPEYGGQPVASPSVNDELSAPAQMGPLQRVGNIFFSPGEVFADIRRSPKDWWLPMVLILVLSTAVGYVVQMRLQLTPEKLAAAAIDSGLEQQGKTRKDLSEAETNAVATQEKVMKYTFQFAPAVGAVILPITFGLGALLYFVLMMVMQAKTTYFRVLSVLSYSIFTTTTVKLILTVVLAFLKTPDTVDAGAYILQGGLLSASPAPLVSMTQQPVLWTFLSYIDVFAIWYLILVAIGLSSITVKKFKVGTAALVAAGPYILAMILMVGLKLLTSK